MEGEREALERTVRRKWKDAAPRLVYADWLDERGETDAASAMRHKRGEQWVGTYVKCRGVIRGFRMPLARYVEMRYLCRLWLEGTGPFPTRAGKAIALEVEYMTIHGTPVKKRKSRAK